MNTASKSAKQVFLEAIEHSPDEWPAYLDQAIGDDAPLRRRVEMLLEAHQAEQSLLDNPAIALAPIATVDQPLTEQAGSQIGPYKLLQQIGEGGMGTVFMAEQTHPVQRKVALKVIKAGMDSSQVIARFEAERQALAMMDHVNIARVLDAGTTGDPSPQPSPPRGEGASDPQPSTLNPQRFTGRPYFVMELVHGVPITKYCDDNHLTPRERLELFVPVCQAIKHAHQKGIIHRDIKPSNVMITLYDGKPVPKVIDFGVAKATEQKLTERTLFTQYGTMVGTLEYMSPEQAEMSALGVDTRSDIYSLGVLLYELLTGNTPLSHKTMKEAAHAEILRMIREVEPPKPSTRLSDSGEALASISANRHTEPAKLTKLVRGELDWIVMKTLEKDRNRRYETANGLAMDLQRYLADEPVLACQPSTGYRFRKFARRNRVPLMTASFMLSALILGTAVSTWQAVRATRAEGLAQSRFEAEKQARNQAQVSLEEARRAEHEKTRQLAIAYVSEAQARRHAGLVGRRFGSLEALKKSAEHFRALGQLDEKRTLELRNEAIACLALADMKPGKKWTPEPGWSQIRWFDPTLQYYAVRTAADDHLDLQQGHLSIRRAADDQEITQLPGFGDRVTIAQFSPNGRYLAAHYGDLGRQLHNYVWDLSRREPILKESHGGYDTLPSFSPDSRLVALAQPDHSIRIYELPSGAKWKDVPPGLPAQRVHFHPDGRQLAVVSGSIVQLRDLEGKELARFKHPGSVFELAWRSDGKVFATGCHDHHIYLWDTANPAQPLRALRGHFGTVVHLAFSHGGDLLLSNSWDSTSRLWDPMTGLLLLSRPWDHYQLHLFGPNDLGLDDWQVATGRECRTFHSPKKPPKWATISPHGPFKGRLMASVGDDGVQLWDLGATREGDKLLDTLPVGESMAVHFDPKGESLITDSKSVGLQRWPITPDQETGGLRIGPPQSPGLSARAPFFTKDPQFTLSADGRTVAHSPQRGQVLLFDLENPRRKLLIESDYLRHAAFSPDGRWLATGNWQGRGVKVWDAQTGKLEADLDLGELVTRHAWPAFSPDGKWLVIGTVAEYRFWEVGSWHKKHGLPRENAGSTLGWIVFSPDGKMLAVLHSQTEVRLVDPATGREFARLPSAGGPYCFSPDGSQLVTYAGRDGAFQVWDLRLIRRHLEEMDLDWDLPPYPQHPSETAKPLRVNVLAAELPPPSKELDAQAHLERGLLYVQLRQCTEATADFNRASTLDPNRPPWEEAVRAYSQAIERNPQDAEAYHRRAHAHERRDQWKEAIDDHSQAIKQNPHNLALHVCRGKAYLRTGEKDKAAEDFRKASAGKPDQANNLAWELATSPNLLHREPSLALELAKQAVRQAPGASYWNTLGVAHYRAGNWEESLAALQKSMDLGKGGDSFDWFFLAMAHRHLGNHDEASKWYDKGVEWMEKNGPKSEELRRFRVEAEE